MSADVRKRLILSVLLLVMAMLWYRVWQQPSTSAPAQAGSAPGGQIAGEAPGAEQLPAVELAALNAARPAPAETGRNLFQYGGVERPAAAPPTPFVATEPAVTAPAAPAQAALSFKLIGIAQPRGGSPRVAILSDERGVYHGSEGAILEGRYRIVRIDADSVELTTLDGSGLYVLRLPPS